MDDMYMTCLTFAVFKYKGKHFVLLTVECIYFNYTHIT